MTLFLNCWVKYWVHLPYKFCTWHSCCFQFYTVTCWSSWSRCTWCCYTACGAYSTSTWLLVCFSFLLYSNYWLIEGIISSIKYFTNMTISTDSGIAVLSESVLYKDMLDFLKHTRMGSKGTWCYCEPVCFFLLHFNYWIIEGIVVFRILVIYYNVNH